MPTHAYEAVDGFRRPDREMALSVKQRGTASLAVLLSVVFALACGDSPRNVILISIDTLRADFLGCYGYDRPTSPASDQLAGDGVLFEDVLATSPWTPPSHASMLTGLYPSHHGLKPKDSSMIGDAIRSDVPTLAEVLGKHGYETAAFVRSVVLREESGFGRGFATFVPVDFDYRSRGPSPVSDLALEWLRDRSERPFFLFLHYYDAHSDYRSLPHYEERFVESYDGIADGTTRQLQRVRRGLVELDDEDARHLANLYAAGVRQVDDEVARILQHLDEARISDQTLIILTSDHGEGFLEHGSVLHGRTFYEEITRVPLVLRGPRIPAGLRVSRPASLVDIVPTIVGLVGIEDVLSTDGIDLSPSWSVGAAEISDDRYLFAEADWGNAVPDARRAVRHGSWKLHVDLSNGETQLYDLAGDRAEQRDLAKHEQSKVARLRAQLATLVEAEPEQSPAPGLSAEEREELRRLGYLE